MAILATGELKCRSATETFSTSRNITKTPNLPEMLEIVMLRARSHRHPRCGCKDKKKVLTGCMGTDILEVGCPVVGGGTVGDGRRHRHHQWWVIGG